MLYPMLTFFSFLKGNLNQESRKFVDFPHLMTNTSETTFQIELDYKFDDSGRQFCIGAMSQHLNSTVHMMPCNATKLKQIWFMDQFGQLRLNVQKQYCLRWVSQSLAMSPDCRSHTFSNYLESNIFRFIFGYDSNSITAARSADAQYTRMGILNGSSYVAMSLHNASESLEDKFYLKDVVYRSEVPSSEPSHFPTRSITPSLQPSACVDEPGWEVGGSSDEYAGLTCKQITHSYNSSISLKWCAAISNLVDGEYNRKTVLEAW